MSFSLILVLELGSRGWFVLISVFISVISLLQSGHCILKLDEIGPPKDKLYSVLLIFVASEGLITLLFCQFSIPVPYAHLLSFLLYLIGNHYKLCF